MSLSAGSAIQQALLMLGVYDPGETPSVSEQNDLLLVLNNLIDNWSQERANIPVILVIAHALTSGSATYTLGPAGSFSSIRPIRITSAGSLVPSAANTGTFVREPIRMVSQEEFAQIVDKSASSQRIEMAYFDYQFPLASINVWPTPGFTGTPTQLELGVWQALADFADLTTVVVTPPGYDRGIVENFAVEIAPQYPGIGQLPPDLLRRAEEAKAAWRQLNMQPVGMPGGGLTSAISVQQPNVPAAGAGQAPTP